MDEQTIFNIMDSKGYHLLDKPYGHSPGFTELLVAIHETPTKQHFDPEFIALCLKKADQKIGAVKLTLTSSVPDICQVCPGQVVLHDRLDKRVYFFVYGGSLETSSKNGITVYALHSPAPILLMSSGFESVAKQLAVETEALLAKVHAEWGLDDEGFMEQLAQADPILLYAATIHSLLRTYQANPGLRNYDHALYEMLLGEKKWLLQLGQWSSRAAKLANVLPVPNKQFSV